jgi:hypothetical protein
MELYGFFGSFLPSQGFQGAYTLDMNLVLFLEQPVNIVMWTYNPAWTRKESDA